jgi:nitrate reductase molybdenum cofactor assembly chaperone NarJ/NarW
MEKKLRKDPRKLYPLFAEILEYPVCSLYECLDECISLLLGRDHEAARLLRKFESILARVPLTEMQEIYTRTFDLQPACFPYVGYHLFAEDYRRGLFMAGLKRKYSSHCFSAGKELPDHLAVILRFLAETSRDKENDELIHECMIPALEKMLTTGLREGDSPYRGVLQGLLLTLQKENEETTAHSGERSTMPLELSF